MEKQDYLLHVEDVQKAYGGKVVLDDVDLAVKKGTLCTVVGPSGCGKSTLLRLILGQERPSSGAIFIEGKPVGYANLDRGIVYQKYSLFPNMSVLDNVLLGKRFVHGYWGFKKRKKEFVDEAMEYLTRVRLDKHIDKLPFELSGGMQQRVAIAQALIMKPKILLMDEPFGALDPGTREDMQVFLLELWEKTKMTIFFVTHDMEEAVFLGTRILVLSQYYTDDRGQTYQRGARIVADHQLKKDQAHSTLVKESEKFAHLIGEIRREGFDPAYQQHVAKFNLKHPDSFQTLANDVHKNQ